MRISLPQISRQVYSTDALEILKNNYSAVGPQWSGHQMEWLNNIYISFKDHDKFLIIIYLIKKTLDFYSRNFTKLNYDEFYSKDKVEIEKFNISDISINLNIPKETARRKILELEHDGIILKNKKKIIIDRSAYIHVKPANSIRRISRWLASFSALLVEEKIKEVNLSSIELEKIIKNNFSYAWKLYYEFQIPMLLKYKSFFNDLESFHIFGSCAVNQHLYTQKVNKMMSRSEFFKNWYSKNTVGINAMSISDITGIPRATVVRKLKKLVKLNILFIDKKKRYVVTKEATNKLFPIQSVVLEGLSDFATKIFNLALYSQN